MVSRLFVNSVAIIAYSIFPLVGILVFGWDWREILIFYWLGNISVGLAVLIDTIKAPSELLTGFNKRASAASTEKLQVMPPFVARIFLAMFFCFHYGLFTLVHGVFVFVIVSGGFGIDVSGTAPLNYQGVFLTWLVATAVSVVVKMVMPTQAVPAHKLWLSAYGRVIALHLSIIVGIFLIQVFHLPAVVAVLLVLVNLMIQIIQMKTTQSQVL